MIASVLSVEVRRVGDPYCIAAPFMTACRFYPGNEIAWQTVQSNEKEFNLFCFAKNVKTFTAWR